MMTPNFVKFFGRYKNLAWPMKTETGCSPRLEANCRYASKKSSVDYQGRFWQNLILKRQKKGKIGLYVANVKLQNLTKLPTKKNKKK